MCGSYKSLYGLLKCDWAYFIFWVRISRGHGRLRPTVGDIVIPKIDISAPFRQRIARFSIASISIANRNWSRSSLLPRKKFYLGIFISRNFIMAHPMVGNEVCERKRKCMWKNSPQPRDICFKSRSPCALSRWIYLNIEL